MIDKPKKWREWVANVSAGTTAGLAALLIAAIATAVFSRVQPLQAWILKPVQLSILQLVAALVGMLMLGWLGSWGLRSLNKERIESHQFSSGAYLRDRVPFQPDKFQGRIIGALREADDEWLSVAQVKERLHVASWQDVRQALSRLKAEGWIEDHQDNRVLRERARTFRLSDQGITYARERGYKTRADKEEFNRLTF